MYIVLLSILLIPTLTAHKYLSWCYSSEGQVTIEVTALCLCPVLISAPCVQLCPTGACSVYPTLCIPGISIVGCVVALSRLSWSMRPIIVFAIPVGWRIIVWRRVLGFDVENWMFFGWCIVQYWGNAFTSLSVVFPQVLLGDYRRTTKPAIV